MTAPLRGGLIGCGFFAVNQLHGWADAKDAEIVAICDRDPERLRIVGDMFGIARRYADAGAMLDAERLDFVDVATTVPSHRPLVELAAARGVAVICQKPFAKSMDDARAMVAACKAAGVPLMVHENFRWQPWYRRIKQLQETQAIGDFTHIQMLTRLGDGWGDNAYLERQPFFREYPRLLLYETGVHFIDTFRFLLGEVTHVYANLRRLNPVIQGEDAGQLFLRFESGATALWDANRYNEGEAPNPRYTFGQLRIDATGGHLTMDTEARLRIKRLGQPGTDVEYEHRNVNFAGDCVYLLQRHFVDCLISGREFESNGPDYLKTTAIVFAAYESARTGQAVKL